MFIMKNIKISDSFLKVAIGCFIEFIECDKRGIGFEGGCISKPRFRWYYFDSMASSILCLKTTSSGSKTFGPILKYLSSAGLSDFLR